jgi:hypothetical protein
MELVIEVAGPCAARLGERSGLMTRTRRSNRQFFAGVPLSFGSLAVPIRGRGRRRGRVRIAIHRR